MTKKLSKEELTQRLTTWFKSWIHKHTYEVREYNEQAYQQLIKLIEGKVSREFVENLGYELYGLSSYDIINKLTKRLKEAGFEVEECSHSCTVCINEEGNAGVFCVHCGEQLEKEC